MCGFAGFVNVIKSVAHYDYVLQQMGNAIAHRGPDDWGVWSDVCAGVALTHRRLSVLDLSPSGHQPMMSSSGRYVIVFNGEIYNHLDLRRELDANTWRGHSDTETILKCFDEWGIVNTLNKAVGMFAFAVWDCTDRQLILVRDRMGEKPLYYGWNRGALLFASELKALRKYHDFEAIIDRNALMLLLRHNCIPAPYSIYRGIFKLLPGAILSFKQNGFVNCPWDLDKPPFDSFSKDGVSLSFYWTLRDVAIKSQENMFAGSDSEAIEELNRILSSAVQAQQISDVPLGALLSGGVDSSTIVSLMQVHATRPLKTFTIGFHEDEYNEARYAKDVARHLGTDHTEMYVSPKEAMAVIPSLPDIYDEPFADSSQIPTFLVSKLAREHVTVALSGDAGDELFGGYNRHFIASAIWRKVGWLPIKYRSALAKCIKGISPAYWNKVYSLAMLTISDKYRILQVGDKVYKFADILAASDMKNAYLSLVSHWRSPEKVIVGRHEPPDSVATRENFLCGEERFARGMMYLDAISYLPDDILVKVDRAAMGVSLETRIPFLDHRVVEFAWRLPLNLKIRNGQSKWILKQILYNYVPKELIERPKTGFSIPLDSWLRGPLREWAEDLLTEDCLRREGVFNPKPIRQKWDEHLSGKRNWQYHLWDVLMFQAWLERWKSV